MSAPAILRAALCPSFMTAGSCVDSQCPYAHSVDELDSNGQMNLMAMLSGGMGSPAGGWGAQAHMGSGGWGGQNRYGGGRHGGGGSHNVSTSQSFQDDSLDEVAGPAPTVRRLPGAPRTNGRTNGTPASASHNTSGSSLQPACPPSPGHSDSDEISTVSNVSGTDGLTASSHAGSANTSSIPPQVQGQQQQQQQPGQMMHEARHPQQAGNYGPHTSPFIKSQMYYSQSANKVTLPERCRYPHATPGTYYDYLNVKRCVTRVEIEKKYQQWRDDGYKKAMCIDQDRADAMDRLIVDAKNVLCSDKMRLEYDAMLPKSAQVSQPFTDQAVSPSQASAQAKAPIGPPSTGTQQQPSSEGPLLSMGPMYATDGLW